MMIIDTGYLVTLDVNTAAARLDDDAKPDIAVTVRHRQDTECRLVTNIYRHKRTNHRRAGGHVTVNRPTLIGQRR